jgi:hypothetical protein
VAIGFEVPCQLSGLSRVEKNIFSVTLNRINDYRQEAENERF